MPTYEYRCPKGHEFERFQKMSDPPRAKCPVCGRNAVLQISGGAGLIFKGSGFYITDYGKDGKGPRQDAPEKDKESKTETTAKSAESQDAAPAAEPGKPAEKGKQEKSEKGEKGDKGNTSDKAEKKSSRKKASS